MRKLLLGILIIILPVIVQAQEVCKNPSGSKAALKCDSSGYMQSSPIGSTTRVCSAITPDTSAYAAGDIIGGKLTFANILRSASYSGILQNIEVTGTELDSIGYTFCLFSADTTTSTVADQGALAVTAADLQKWRGCWAVSTQSALAAVELYQTNNMAVAVDAAGTSLYGVLRTAGAPTWAAGQTVNVCLTVLQD